MRVGLVAFCNDGYPKEELLGRLSECRRVLRGADLVDIGLVCTGDEAREKAHLADGVDAVAVACLSACGSGYTADFLLPHFDKPMLLWHVPAENALGHTIVTGAAAAGFASLRYPLQKLGAKRLSAFSGQAQAEETRRFIAAWLRAARAFTGLKAARIGMAGYTDLGFYSGTFDHISLKRKFGAEIVHISLTEVADEMQKAPEADIAEFLKLAKGWECASPLGDGALNNAAKAYSALNGIAGRYSLGALSLKCFEGFTAGMGFTPCIPLSLMADKLCVSCKCDMHATLSVMALSLISEAPAAFFELYDTVNGNLLVANCGMSPMSHIEGARRLDRFTWGGIDGVIDASRRREGAVTLLRLDKDETNGYLYHAVSANAKEPPKWKELGWSDPAPAFPSLEIETDGAAFLNRAPGQHYALCYGDYSRELELFAQMLDIERM